MKLFDLFKASGGSDIRKPDDVLPVDSAELKDLNKVLDQMGMNPLANLRRKQMQLMLELPDSRFGNYDLYDEMDDEGSNVLTSSALDMLAEDATQKGVDEGKALWIESEDPKVQKELEDLIAKIGLEGRLVQWVRMIAKYGDVPIQLIGSQGKGITSVRDDYHPGQFARIEEATKEGMRLYGFYLGGETYPPWGTLHLKLPGTTVEKDPTTGKVIPNQRSMKRINTSYGQSLLFPVRRLFRQLSIAEDAILLSRLTNSIRRYLFKVNVGTMDPAKAVEQVKKYQQLLKSDISLDINNGTMKSRAHIPSYTEDHIIPVAGERDFQVETLGGDVNIKEAFDVEYLKGKFFAGLRIPQAFMSYLESLNSRSTLSQLDVRYARTVNKLQTSVKVGLYRMCRIHLAFLGMEKADFSLRMPPVSLIEEENIQDIRQRKLGIAREMIDIMTTIEEGHKNSMEGPAGNEGDDGGGFSFEGKEAKAKVAKVTPDELKPGTLFNRKYLMQYVIKTVMRVPDDEASHILTFSSAEARKKPKVKKTTLSEMAALDFDILQPLPNECWTQDKETLVESSCYKTILDKVQNGQETKK